MPGLQAGARALSWAAWWGVRVGRPLRGAGGQGLGSPCGRGAGGVGGRQGVRVVWEGRVGCQAYRGARRVHPVWCGAGAVLELYACCLAPAAGGSWWGRQ